MGGEICRISAGGLAKGAAAVYNGGREVTRAMTTAIPDIADLVKVLREQPEWAETLRAILLTQELLELPEKLARLTARVEEFIAQQTETNRLVAEQLAQLTAQQARLAEQQSRLTEQLARLTTRVEEFIAQQTETNRLVAEQLAQLTEQQARLTEQLARLTTRVEEFIAEQQETNKLIAERLARQEADTAELKADMSEVKADVAELKADMSGLKDTVGRMQGTVGRLQGAELERRVHANIAGLICNPLGIRRPRVLKSLVLSSVPELFNILHPAQDDGRIDQDQFDSLMQADIILSGRDRAAQPLYVVIEVSRTVHDYDLTRARERADIMAAAGGEPTLALVMGYIIPPPQRRKAEELGVHLMQSAQLADAGVGED